MLWSGNGLQLIVDNLSTGVEGEHKTFFALFGMMRSGLVDEAKGISLTDYVHYLTQVHRPEPECINLDCDNLAQSDANLWIRNPYPTEIKLTPPLKSAYRFAEN